MELKVGILAIGNEVVEGQIINSNGAWLSRELHSIGFKSLFHLSCPDSFIEITKSLDFLSHHCQLILISGGLGPTVDDTTRQCLSQWTSRELEFCEKQWTLIKNRLKNRQVTLREGHRNQAYIPKGAEVLSNNFGVAPGFFLKTSRLFLASLPGPPQELKSMFKEELKHRLQRELNPKKEKKLYTWLCFGVPESEIAHKTESVLGKTFELGFRLLKPYVEIKVWAPLELSKEQKDLFLKLEKEIKFSFVGYNLFEIRKEFYEILNVYQGIHVLDYLTSGLFLEKINDTFQMEQIHYQCFGKKFFRYFSRNEVEDFLNQKDQFFGELLGLFPKTKNSAFVVFNNKIYMTRLHKSHSVQSHLGQLFIIESVFLRITKRFPEHIQWETD